MKKSLCTGVLILLIMVFIGKLNCPAEETKYPYLVSFEQKMKAGKHLAMPTWGDRSLGEHVRQIKVKRHTEH